MTILIAPDKFKGSLTGEEAATAIGSGILKVYPDADIVLQPMADGGEGTLDLLKNQLELEEVSVAVSDPLQRKIEASYYKKATTAYRRADQTCYRAWL